MRARGVLSGHPTKDVHPEPAEGLFSYSPLPAGQSNAISLHGAPFSVPKTLATNSRVSITSKLIETKRLQVLYSGHLRKTGGRGSYQFAKKYSTRPSRCPLRISAHSAPLRWPSSFPAPIFALSFLPIPTLGSLSLQLLAHSFIFRIISIRCPPTTFRTLLPKTRVYPLRPYQCFRRSPSFVKKPLLCVPSQRTLRLCGESLFSLLATRHSLRRPITNHFRGTANVIVRGRRRGL